MTSQIDARDWIFEIGDSAQTTWTTIEGITEWSEDPAANEETSDDTTFSSRGRYEGAIMQRGASIELTGRFLMDADGNRDPGQQAVEDAAELVGTASRVPFRFRHVSQPEWKVWPEALFSLSGRGGGNNDRTSWGCTVTRSGQSTTEAVVA